MISGSGWRGSDAGNLRTTSLQAAIETVSRAQLSRILAVNVEGVLFTLQAVSRQMIAQGRGGKIINVASDVSRRGEEYFLAYAASRAAVMSITRMRRL